MKRQRTRAHEQKIRVWAHDEARKALPYVASIVQSMREYRLEALSQDRLARKLDAKPGRLNAQEMIAQQEAAKAARRANHDFEDTLAELNALDIYCLDPVRGLALIPFVHGDQLAWYIFDLFDGDELRTWRFHTDPLDTRRPVAQLQEWPLAPVEATAVV